MIQQINNLINNQVEGPILKAKSDLKIEAKKEILKIKEKIPTIEDVKSQFMSLACSEAAKKKVEWLYNKMDSLLEKLENISDKIRKKIEDLKNKLQKILEDILPKIALILGILAILIDIAKTLVRTIPAAEAANSVPSVGSPTLATRLKDFYNKAKDKIELFGAAIKVYMKKIEKITKVVTAIIATVFSVVGVIILMGDKIKLLRSFLLFLYLKYKSECETSADLTGGTCNLPDYTSKNACISAGGIWNNPNEEIMNGNMDLDSVREQIDTLYGNLIEQLGLEGKKEIIEIVTNTVTQYDHKHERKIVPIT